MAFNSLFGKTFYLLFYILVSKIIHSVFLATKMDEITITYALINLMPKNPRPAVSLIFSCWFFSLQYKNLEKPYPTNCTKRSLKAYTSYTVEGCFFECKAEIITKKCGCRLSGYTGIMKLKQETTNHWVTPKNPVVTAEKKDGKIEEERKTKE